MPRVHERTGKKCSGKKICRPDRAWIEEVLRRPHIKAILEEPVGTPIDFSKLTREEMDALAWNIFGAAPHGPTGEEYVREVRPILGESIIMRAERHGI